MAGHIQEHPDYAEGFYAAQEGRPCHAHASREFATGWASYWRAARILRKLDDAQRAA